MSSRITMSGRLCSRCVLPEAPPDITLDADGVCNICHNHDLQAAEAAKSRERGWLETDFLKVLDKHRGKKEYDCLCMLSGGKDSTAALYYVVRRYKLKPLVFTFNHGFVPDEHLESAQKTVKKLGVDFLYFQTTFMKDMFRKIVQTKSKVVICPVCSLWYMLKTYEIAAMFDIPIIISGWTKGQTSGGTRSVLSKCACDQDPDEFRSMSAATKEFMDNHVRTDPKYKDFPRNMEEVLKTAKRKYKYKGTVLSPHWFVPGGPEEYVPVIQKELVPQEVHQLRSQLPGDQAGGSELRLLGLPHRDEQHDPPGGRLPGRGPGAAEHGLRRRHHRRHHGEARCPRVR
jgi:hypothetical protein